MRKSVASLIFVPLVALLSGCHSQPQPLPPTELRAQFIQAVTNQDTQTMAHLLAQPDALPALQLQSSYDTPESEKDPTLRGETLGMWALRTGRFSVVPTLLMGRPAIKNDFGRTPLMYAALYGPEVGPNKGMLSWVMPTSSGPLGDVDFNGDSALFLALRRGALNATTQLLFAGAPVTAHHVWIRNKQGQSALDLARASKNKDLVGLVSQAASGHKIHSTIPVPGQ